MLNAEVEALDPVDFRQLLAPVNMHVEEGLFYDLENFTHL